MKTRLAGGLVLLALAAVLTTAALAAGNMLGLARIVGTSRG